VSKLVANIAKQRGLTLIELLISLVIISTVITLCANGFSFGNRVWAKVDEQQDHLDEVVSAQRFLRKALSEAVFYPLNEDELKNNYFNGESEKMLFLAPSPQYGLDDYLYIYELYKLKSGDTYNLSLRYLPANSYFSGTAKTTDKHVELVRDIKNLKFNYYGLNRLTGELAWFDAWLNQDVLPLLVSISVEYAGEKQTWPTLIVETKYGSYSLP